MLTGIGTMTEVLLGGLQDRRKEDAARILYLVRQAVHQVRQLAHIERNAVRAAYHRAEYLKERAALMQWWGDYLDGRRGGKVVKLGLKVKA